VGEPFQVRQAVRNLVTNAGEATPPGGWVKVEADRRTIGAGESGAYVLAPPPGEYVMIRVSDSGSGMTGEVKAKAFDPFFSTKFAGRGLGLAAVLGIVRGHRGGVRLASAVGRGTLIELYFPLSNTPAERSLLPPSSGTFPAPVRPAPPEPGGTRGAVLVCDDELNIRELIATVLEGDGFRVVRARDGVEGVAAFAREPAGFVLAVVDLLMPGLGGHEVVRRVRQLRPALPAVLVSGFADRELPADVRASGPTTLLPKPFRLEHLSAVVGQLLRGSGVSEA
jgi:CheY-like chemotaxis protein